jgi:hypothetical protein
MTMPDDPTLLHSSFYTTPELAYQRVTTKEWKAMLLAERDRPIVKGRLRRVVARNLGAGVLELRLAPLEENDA